MTKFFNTINDYNLCTYYILPLLQLNRHSFGADNFVQCYVSEDGTKVIIKMKRIVQFVYDRTTYVNHYQEAGHIYLVLEIPAAWTDDVRLFRDGRYSQFSTRAKDMIRSFSGLLYKQTHPKTLKVHTDARLMALDESPAVRQLLRNKLEEELGCTIPEENELISIPATSNYIPYIPEYTY